MSLDYYSKLVAKKPQGEDKLYDAIRIGLDQYRKLVKAGALPGLGLDDIDELISIMAARALALTVSYDPEKAAFSTYMTTSLRGALLSRARELYTASGRMITGVFDAAEESEEDGQSGPIATDAGVTSLPITDLVYAEPPLGLMEPDKAEELSERASLLQALRDDRLSPRDFAIAQGIQQPTESQLAIIRRRRDELKTETKNVALRRTRKPVFGG